MQMITRAMTAIKSVLDVERRAGVFVSRPVTNGQEWYDWAVKHGVPDPLPPEEMHVTIISSLTDVKMIPEKTVRSIYIGPGYGDAGCFTNLGPTGAALCVCFGDWDLYDRHWNFMSNGAVTKWPTYRPHMTISMNAAGFELSDAALSDAPLYISLGGEVYADLKQPDDIKTVGVDPEGVDGTPEEAAAVEITQEVRAAAVEILESGAMLSPLDRLGLLDIAHGHPITRGIATRLGGQNWASAELKAMIKEPKEKPQTADASRTRDVVVTIGELPAELRRDLPMFSSNDEERTVFGIANITTVGGDLVVDAHNTAFTTRAMTGWLELALQTDAGCDFSHEGPATMRIAQGIVLRDYMQHALGIDLGFEPTLVLVRVPDDADWAKVKRGDWMFSIAGTFTYEEVEVA